MNDIRNNSINLIRYVAAFQIMLQHTINHFGMRLPKFLSYISGVPIFFCLSGFLICLSLEKNTTFKKYITRRFKRIYPELWFTTFLNIILLSIFIPGIWKNFSFYIYLLAQTTFFQCWTPSILNNYGTGVPNGSLWTIAIFVQFYLVIYFAYKYFKKISIKKDLFFLASMIIINILTSYLELFIPNILYKLYQQTIIPYLYMFYLGIIIYKYQKVVIKPLKDNFYIILLIYFITNNSFYIKAIPSIYIDPINGVMNCLLAISFAYKFNNVKIKEDYSYGIYLCHMLFVNVMIELGLTTNIIYIVCVCFLSCITAILSKKVTNVFIKLIKI